MGAGLPYEYASDVCRSREVAISPAGPVRIEWRLAPYGQIEISGPDIPCVTIEHVESAAERAAREKAEARAAAKSRLPPLDRNRVLRFQGWASRPDLFGRKREAVRLTVADAVADLRPQRAVMRRSSYDVRAQVDGRDYLLSQKGRRRAEMLRSGIVVAELVRPAAYRTSRPRYEDAVTWGVEADSVDVAMTHSLANAYRVGANGFVLNLLKVLTALTVEVLSNA